MKQVYLAWKAIAGMKLRISCSEGCCCWSVCFVYTELVNIIRSHNSLRHVRGWKKIAEMQEVFLVSGQTLSFKSSSMMLTSLTSKSTAVICLSSSLHQIGAPRQICVCTCQQMACSGIPFGSYFTILRCKVAPMLGSQGHGLSCEGV